MNKIKISHDSEKPAHGQQVITACAFIYHDFFGAVKVFMPQRALTKKFLPGVYELPGGHIDFGEDILMGLQREIHEEFGMHIVVGEPFFAFTYFNEIKGSHTIEVIYLAQFVEDPKDIILHPQDHVSAMWITEKEIDRIMTQNKQGNDPEIQAIRRGFERLHCTCVL